ncbi:MULTISPECIES: GNAT family N-acetyltransferase [unclassified Pseudoclavibacter]|uniref:GNAT family N-acetyltransferase n=1 Tax=unclassified Pseudoclavibacter TaxID=2615177 RepID=UPI000CE72AD2|nr:MULTISPECIES: GNAT family N-acetyltransferase [unclassified Pseudoclavibacter]MBF4550774.1 GNAT family N-acetyltransferase [Pseudoclavibacter sp. VKM Ac-2888]PPG05424.1 GNAT family N-acetyltransferase [Pseudoclavibacter sp. RFBI5]
MTEPIIRPAVPSDVPQILDLIRGLAVYEREPDAVKTTEAQLHRSFFGERPAVFATVAEAAGASTSEPGAPRLDGMALWFLSYSTWEGEHGIWLEDLYVREATRGGGLGTALLRSLAQECVAEGYRRLEWSVLKWNEPSIGFYRSLGAFPMDEWDTFRLTGDPLQALGG